MSENIAPNFDAATGEIIDAGTAVVQRADLEDSQAVEHLIANFADATGSIYTTVQGDDMDTKLAVIGAISGADRIDEHLDEKIMLVDFVIQAIEVSDPNTGQINAATRVILIDDQGEAYAGISKPLVSSLQLITQLAGHPSTWAKPVAVVVQHVKTRAGFTAFNLVPYAASKLAKKEKAAAKK